MKRHWIFRIVCILLAIIIPWMIKSLPTPLLDKDCSPLYQRYADDPDIEASFVKGFRINDTLAIDATLLRAKDSAGWVRLTEELEIPKATERVIIAMEEGGDLIMSYLATKGTASQCPNPDIDNSDAIGVSYLNRTIGVYHIHGIKEYRAILYYNTDISTSNNIAQ